ncbi:hypothetical protein KC906_01705, partial [Candidatus Kaiserbacteria bacterium]|nr:hypothetical protein [Candidatus Kaiserbacteria bacterium]
VVVQTADNQAFASKPAAVFGTLDRRDWLQMREVIRGEMLRFKQQAGMEGFLLKRRIFGPACSCIDVMTGESRDADCSLCYGTAFAGGYYDPYPCFYVERKQNSGFRSYNSEKGTTNDGHIISGRCLNIPAVFSYDTWVEKSTDDRYYFHKINSVVSIRGYDIVMEVELRRAAYNDIIYTFPVA